MPSNPSKELYSAVEAGGEEQATQAYMAIRRGARDAANEPIQPKVAPFIDTKRCSGCGRCVAACPERIITLETQNHHKHAIITEPQQCSNCGACVTACPIEAISSVPFSP